jgi:enoyl reductase-like protein
MSTCCSSTRSYGKQARRGGRRGGRWASTLLRTTAGIVSFVPLTIALCLPLFSPVPPSPSHFRNMQFPLCLTLKRDEGFNIDVITVAAGVPGPEKASEICEAMLAAGINKLGFKPGTVGAISSVVEIARANPKMHIILQWTGGRSGGHHSMEDQHVPLLASYALIRTQPNIILVLGGGIGDAESALPYLTGLWSTPAPYYRPPMPVDGLLFGSRFMVALECPTDPRVKELIVNTPGVTNEKEWEQSLTGIAGGVVTIQSELGEPIHKIATRGVLFWRELDEKFFSITNKDALKAALMKNKNYIITRLNEDFQKPYCTYRRERSACEE